MSQMPRRLGIDPAPGKGLLVFDPKPGDGLHFRRVEPKRARNWLAAERSKGALLVGWDAPLAAAFDETYTERPVEGLLKDKFGPAVAVRGYSGCPHWTISLDVLGYPLPTSRVLHPDDRLPLRYPGDGGDGEGVVETHPALALALLWPEGEALPVYKPKKGFSAEVCRTNVRAIEDHVRKCAEVVFGAPWVDLPEKTTQRTKGVTRNALFDGDVHLDDLLDAQLSYLCVEAMVAGKALCLGDPRSGYFAVPKTPTAQAWKEKFDLMAEAASR